jgi:hypothetical protein
MKQNGYILSLRTSDVETKTLWMGAIASFANATAASRTSRHTEEGRLACAFNLHDINCLCESVTWTNVVIWCGVSCFIRLQWFCL